MTFKPSQSSLRDASSPEGGALFTLTGRIIKAPPLGELDATNGSGLRGFYTSISFPSSNEQMPL